MKIANDRVVSFHYTLTGDKGNEIDSSKPGSPFVYLHGAAGIVPGLERELEGKSAGDRVQVTVQPDEGYGLVNQELVRTVPREAFQGVEKVEPGMQFQASRPDGHAQVVTVTGVGEEGVTIDANHPLAGQVLHFDVTVESVREATPEELDHGHAH